jgi:Lrp/AsnC family transcriptional regulator, regulator for asnA, asnC and gidA
MKGLDEKDAIILRELLADGRKSFVSIAKQLQTTKEIIWKRYKDLEKAGIINGATIQFNYARFGYESIATICLNVDSSHLSNVLQNLRKIPDLNAWQVYNATFNIMVITTFKSLKNLDDVKALLKNNPTNSVRTYLWTDVKNIPENMTFGFLKEKLHMGKLKEDIEVMAAEGTLRLDNLDTQIVEQLNKNGRMPFSEIAKNIGSSTDTVARRYSRLIRNGYIKVTIQINPSAAGYKGLATCLLSIHSQEAAKIAIEELATIPNISYITKISGDYELQFALLIRDFEDLLEVNKRIMMLSGIEKIETSFREVPAAWPGPKQYITTF